jgi:RNA polymerase sigma factor (sigma-70 family)
MKHAEFEYRLVNEISHLKSFAKNFTQNTDDSNDLTQETLLKALRFWNLFEEGTNFEAWLYTIMRNAFVTSYQSKVRLRSKIMQVEDLSSIQLLLGSVPNSAESEIRTEEIKSALTGLEKDFYTPFTMYVEGYKYHEIAEALSVPIGTIKNRIHMARRLIKKILEHGYSYKAAG